MNCPKCVNTELASREIHGVSVDTCAACGGAWIRAMDLEHFTSRAHSATRSISIPSVISQKKEEYEVVYDGAPAANTAEAASEFEQKVSC